MTKKAEEFLYPPELEIYELTPWEYEALAKAARKRGASELEWRALERLRRGVGVLADIKAIDRLRHIAGNEGWL